MFETPVAKAGSIIGVAALVCALGVVLWKQRAAPPAPSAASNASAEASATGSAPSAAPVASDEETIQPLPPKTPFRGALDCKGVGPPPPANCPAPAGPLPDLVRAGNGFFMTGGGHCGFTNPLRGERLESALQAVRAAAAHTWTAEPVVERVVGQNAALRLALCTEGERSAALRREALSLVHRMALPSPELEALGTEPVPEIGAWLGDRSTWQDLRSRNKNPLS